MIRLKTAASAAVLAIAVSGLAAQTVLSRLGVSETHAHEIVMSAIQGMFSVGSAAKPFLSLAPGARAAAVNDVVGWAKTYFASATFKQAWAAERAGAKPEADAATGTVDDELKAKIADALKSIDDARKMIATLPADQRTQMESVFKQQADQIKDPAYQAKEREQIVAARADKDKQFQDDVKKWQEDDPADPNVLIAKQLHAFLTMSADVNFDAKVETRDGMKVFVDPQYESKPSNWKMCYRAGREATQAARAAATQWLKELGR